MIILSRNGVNYASGLVYQYEKEAKKKLDLNYYLKQTAFKYYLPIKSLGQLHAFGEALENYPAKVPLPICLTGLILSMFNIDENTDNQILCFKFDEALYAYLVYINSTILPDDGEFIGSEKEVMSKIEILSKRFKIHKLVITDDVPFAKNNPFAQSLNIELNLIQSPDESVSSSEYMFFSAPKSIINANRLKPLKPKSKKPLIIASMAVLLSSIGMFLYNTYSADDVTDLVQPVVINNTEGVAPKMILETCFKDLDTLLVNNAWQTNKITCNLKGLTVDYSTEQASISELTNSIKQYANALKFPNNTTAQLTIPNMLSKVPVVHSNEAINHQIDQLNLAAAHIGVTVQINQDSWSINTNFSPIYLYNNNVLTSDLNVSDITYQLDPTGFANWSIKGVFNGK